MLDFIDCYQEDAVAWRIDGKVTEEDMHAALDAVKRKIDTYGHVCVYQEIGSLGGVEFDAILEKLEFLASVGISAFRRIAVVTDKRWVKRVIDWENRIFRGIDLRAFAVEERGRAFNFLAYGDDIDPAPDAA
ncbi:MAG: STAS/SEC14 domain-containing protein [Congregibacter sp.]